MCLVYRLYFRFRVVFFPKEVAKSLGYVLVFATHGEVESLKVSWMLKGIRFELYHSAFDTEPLNQASTHRSPSNLSADNSLSGNFFDFV
jgi:hypothetical protein